MFLNHRIYQVIKIKIKYMKYILLLLLLLSGPMLHAQFGKRLKEKAKETAERKANQKVDEALNKSADKIDSVITGKKRDTKSTKQRNEETASTNENNGAANTDAGDPSKSSTYDETIIKTNIRCETGKKKMELILRDTDGVSSAFIDNDTGKLYLSSANAKVHDKVVELVRQNGFEADAKKPTKVIANPCK